MCQKDALFCKKCVEKKYQKAQSGHTVKRNYSHILTPFFFEALIFKHFRIYQAHFRSRSCSTRDSLRVTGSILYKTIFAVIELL